MPIIEPSALDSSGREHVCFFLKTFCKKFLHSAFLFMNIYDVPLEIALKCDCKVLGLGLTSGNKATQGANFTISH